MMVLVMMRGGVGSKRIKHSLRGLGDFGDAAVESFLVSLGRCAVARDFTHKLQCGGFNFLGCRRGLKIKQWFDAATHSITVGCLRHQSWSCSPFYAQLTQRAGDHLRTCALRRPENKVQYRLYL